MMGDPRKRWWILGGLLIGAAGLAFFGDSTPYQVATEIASPPVRPTETADSTTRSSAKSSRTKSAPDVQAEPTVLLALKPRDELIHASPPSSVDLFTAMSWAPPQPPPPSAPMPVVAPVAPPLPYTYVGKKQQGGQWEVYLLKDELTYIVHQGSIVEDQYVVEHIEPPSMRFKYRPLGQVQTLMIGE